MLVVKNRYIAAGLAVYTAALFYLHIVFQLPFSDFLVVFVIMGIGFSWLAWRLTKNLPAQVYQPIFKNEVWLLLGLIVWVAFYITYGGSLINKLFPATLLNSPQTAALIIFVKKLFVFVLIPFVIYKAAGFGLKDFGLVNNTIKFTDKRLLLIFICLSIAAVLFQFFFSNGSKPFRNGQFSILQIITGLPLCFIYLLFDAGLIEEFFFRGLLQSRLAVLLKSPTGGIVVGAIIFGLVHAPGLYLRGAEGEGVSEQMPFLFWAAYAVAYMGIAGIFLGIVYQKTKNLLLVMAIHAMVDLLPNFADFVKTWHL